MSYALVQDGVIKTEDYPRVWFDGTRFWDFRDQPPDPKTGWLPVVKTPCPPETETTKCIRTLELIDGLPTEVWVEQQKTLQEIETEKKEQNRAKLKADAVAQVVILINAVTELNAITALDNNVIRDNPAPTIKTLTRICKTVARQAIRVAKLVTDDTLSVDTGIE